MFNYISYQQRLNNSNEELTYLELLLTTEWKNKRDEVLGRDGYCCTACKQNETILLRDNKSGKLLPHTVYIPENCSKHLVPYEENGERKTFAIFDSRQIKVQPAAKNKRMHVHHTYYLEGSLPWEYEAEALATMCEKCHFDFHANNVVTVYRLTHDGLEAMENLEPCNRCGGAGRLPEYDYVQGGICFRCWGACYEQWITPKLVEKSKKFYEEYKKQ